MSQVTSPQADLEKGRETLDILYHTSPIIIRMDVDEMPQEQAQRIWNNLKPFRGPVASKAGLAGRRQTHLQVLRMMSWIEKKAEPGE